MDDSPDVEAACQLLGIIPACIVNERHIVHKIERDISASHLQSLRSIAGGEDNYNLLAILHTSTFSLPGLSPASLEPLTIQPLHYLIW